MKPLSEVKKKEFVQDLFELLRIPSITRNSVEVKQAATWLERRLLHTGIYSFHDKLEYNR